MKDPLSMVSVYSNKQIKPNSGINVTILEEDEDAVEDESEDVTDNHAEHEARDNEENVKNNKPERIGTNKSWRSFCI